MSAVSGARPKPTRRAERLSAYALLVAIAAAIVYDLTMLRVDADFTAFLPRGATLEQQVLIHQLRSGAAAQVVVIGLGAAEGAQPGGERLAELNRRLAAKLDSSHLFVDVQNGDPSRLERVRDLLFAQRYLIGPAVSESTFEAAPLRASLEQVLEVLSSSLGPAAQPWLRADPTGESLRILEQQASMPKPSTRHGVWFSASGDMTMLLATSAVPASDLDAQVEAATALQRAFQELAAPDAALKFTGAGFLAAESRRLIVADARLLASLAGLVVLAILFAYHRRFRIVLLSALPTLAGLAVGCAVVGLGFGSLHGITLAFGATLIGESVDYPTYLLSQKRAGESGTAVFARIDRPFVLAVVTTMFGSLAMIWTDFPGLAQLGVLTLVGVVVAGVVTRLLVAPATPIHWAPPARSARLSGLLAFAALPLPRFLAVALAAVSLAFVATLQTPLWDDDAARMNPLPKEVLEADRMLRQSIGGADVSGLLLVTGDTQDAALEAAARLRPELVRWRAAGLIAGFDLVSDYLPSRLAQLKRQQTLPEAEVLRERLRQATAGLPFRADAFEPFIEAVERARVGGPIGRESYRGTPLELRLANLMIDGSPFVVLVPLAGISDPETLQAELRRADPALRWLGIRSQTGRMLEVYREQALTAAAIGGLLIFAAIWFGERGLRPALRLMLPVVAALCATVATLLWIAPLSLFNLVALLLVLGMGTNYALFFRHASRSSESRDRTLACLLLVTATSACGFATLLLAQAPVLRALGQTVTAGVLFCFLFCAVFLGRADPVPATQEVR